MSEGDSKPRRRLDDVIDAMDCTEEVRVRLRVKLAAAREASRRAIEAARARRFEPRPPDDWLPVGDVVQRLRAAVEEARHQPAMSVAQACAMIEAFDSTKH